MRDCRDRHPILALGRRARLRGAPTRLLRHPRADGRHVLSPGGVRQVPLLPPAARRRAAGPPETAPRAAHSPPGRPLEQMPALTERFRAEHAELLPMVDGIRGVANRLDSMEPRVAFDESRQVHRFLVERLLPHEAAEEQTFYPQVAEVLG